VPTVKGKDATPSSDEKYQKMEKLKREKFKLHELVVGLPRNVNRENWLKTRKKIKVLENLSGKKP
jgi:RNase H-fold protein (predicted Holliday junction resolvase)